MQLLRKQIRKSDAIIFASTEYNYSMSGVLKNSIDWASRGPNGNSFMAKTGIQYTLYIFNISSYHIILIDIGSIIGAAGGNGSARSQHHLRQTAVFLQLNILPKPEIQISAFQDGVFNHTTGDLLDETWQKRLLSQVEVLRDYTYKLKLGQLVYDEVLYTL